MPIKVALRTRAIVADALLVGGGLFDEGARLSAGQQPNNGTAREASFTWTTDPLARGNLDGGVNLGVVARQ